MSGRVERAVADLRQAPGVDAEDGHLRETPRRVAAAYAEMLSKLPRMVEHRSRRLQVQERLTRRGG